MNDLICNIFKKTTFALLFVICVTATAFAAAKDPAPMLMLKHTSGEMIGELNKHLGQLKNNDALVVDIVKRTVVPHFDLPGMAQTVVGRNYWQKEPQSTQQQFITAFTDYVIVTYSNAIASYDGETIKFYPLRDDVGAQTRLQINSDLTHKDAPPVHIQYRVVNKDGVWFIYDFSIDGVSLVRNYQAQFAGTLQQGGLPLLIKKLKENNKTNLAND